MSLTKAELRYSLKQARAALPADIHRARSSQIALAARELIDWPNTQAIHIFEPIAELHEVNLEGLVPPDFSGELFTSRKQGSNWNIVPLTGDAPVPERFDVIIVPMLGFDDSLNRIGYGGGYYDRFLATQPQAQKIGVCFDLGHLTDPIPAELYDISLNHIVTEAKIYT